MRLPWVEPGVAPQPGPNPLPLKFSFRIIWPVEEPKADRLTLCPQVMVVALAEAFMSHWANMPASTMKIVVISSSKCFMA